MNLSVNSGLKQGYTLDIIGYDKWPSVSVKYGFSNIGAIPQLHLNYKFDTTGYLPQTCDDDIGDTEVPAWQQKAAHALVIFKNIHYQLNWGYTNDEKPAEHIRVIQHAATCTISPAIPITFTDGDIASLSKFVKTIIKWLQRITDSTPTSALPTRAPAIKPIVLAVTGELEQKNIFELAVNLVVSRMDTDTGLQAGQSTKNIHPDIKTGISLKTGQKAFAQKFETAFKITGCLLKLAAGRGDYNNATQLWAVRLADGDTGNGISYTISPDLVTSFAPIPFSKNLIGGNILVPAYTSGKGIDWNGTRADVSFSGVDLDKWVAIFLQSIDKVLTKPAVDAVLTCAKLNTLQQPDGINPLQQILNNKAGMSNQLVKRLMPVFTEQTGNLNNAAQHLTNQLNHKLAYIYSGTAIVQFNASLSPNSGTELVNLYGRITPVSADKTAAYSEALLPNAAKSTLTFTVSAHHINRQTYLPISVNYQPTGLDYKSDEGIMPLSFIVLPVADSTVLNGNVPMVLRAYPQPPEIFDQIIEKTYSNDVVTLQSVKLYDYIYRYTQPTVAHDVVETQLIINESVPVASSGYGDTDDLFKTLAQFISVYPQIFTDLEVSLPLINTTTTVDSSAYRLALPALNALAELTGKVNAALSTTDNTLKPQAVNPNPKSSYTFTLKQSPVTPVADKRLVIQLTAQKGQSTQLSLPLVLLDGYDAVLLDTVDTDTEISKSYIFVSAGEGPLLYNGKLTTLSPQIKFTAFDILIAEKINITVKETRNKNLVPNPKGGHYSTNERFIYTVPTKSNIPAITPQLLWNDVEVDIAGLNKSKAKAGLQDSLQLLFGNLLSSANPLTYNIGIKVTYEYKIDDSVFLPPVALPVLLTTPMPISNINKDGIAQQLGNQIQNWLNNIMPEGNEPRLYFDVEIFTSLKEPGTPLLTITRLYLNLSDVN